MEPLLIILIPGLLGGLVLALLIRGTRRAFPPTLVPRRLWSPSPSLINMAHIPVEGVGGLGMLAAVVIVAVNDSRIGLATAIAFVLGGGLALALVSMRRRTGSMPSAGGGPEDRSLLHLGGVPRGRPGGRVTGPGAGSSRWLDPTLRPSLR
jgi:hypothetical protein